MDVRGYALFDTPVGTCGIAWSDTGIVGIQLPEADPGAARARLLRRHGAIPSAVPPPSVQQAIDGIVALLQGAPVDLAAVALDLDDLPAFERSVYDMARSIPPGRTLTYGEIAARLGDPALARDVGKALGRNPCPIVVPCHRVVAAGGKLGGFSARGGAATKQRMLAIEQAAPAGQPDLFAPPPAG